MDGVSGFPVLRIPKLSMSAIPRVHHISTAEQLRNIGNPAFSDNEYSAGDFRRFDIYRLSENITIPSGVWTPYSVTANTTFNGILDGNGYTINVTGAVTGTANNFGLVGHASNALFRNIDMHFAAGSQWGSPAVRRNNTGAIIGTGIRTAVSNCHVSAETDSGGNALATVFGGNHTGGLIGFVTGTGAALVRSSSAVNIDGQSNTGGFAGGSNFLADDQIRFVSCWATGGVVASGIYAGGFIGNIGHLASFSRSSATGNVIGAGAVGGFIGSGFRSNDFSDCYALGNVTITTGAVSIAPDSTTTADIIATASAGAGGFMGSIYRTSTAGSMRFNRNMAAGSVTSTAPSGNFVHIGGFIGATDINTRNVQLGYNAVLTNVFVTQQNPRLQLGRVIGFNRASIATFEREMFIKSEMGRAVMNGTNFISSSSVTNLIGQQDPTAPEFIAEDFIGKTLAELGQAETYSEFWDFMGLWMIHPELFVPIHRIHNPDQEFHTQIWFAFNNRGTVEYRNINIGVVDEFEVPADMLNLEFGDWTFMGWYSSNSTTGIQFVDADGVMQDSLRGRIINAEGGDTIVLHARWQVEMEFKMGDATAHDTANPLSYELPEPLIIIFRQGFSLPQPMIDWYIFNGWHSANGVGGVWDEETRIAQSGVWLEDEEPPTTVYAYFTFKTVYRELQAIKTQADRLIARGLMSNTNPNYLAVTSALGQYTENRLCRDCRSSNEGELYNHSG
jgi:hypothetical protein